MYSLEAIKSELPYYQEVMLFYKVNPCTTGQQQKNPGGDPVFNTQCDRFLCFGYHNLNERRRSVFDEETPGLLYQPIKCSSMTENGACAAGDFCKFSHNQNEILYHPLYYKTESCEGCIYEKNVKFCPYYHSDEVSRKINLDKFKAKMNKEVSKPQQIMSAPGQGPFDLDSFKANPCPFKGNHNPKVCAYYHHDKDRKRPVSVFNYSSNLCPYASKGCTNGDNCTDCHNKVEQLYHPERYKKKFCLCHPHNIYKCEYGDYCSFAHSEGEIQIELLHNLKKDEHFYLYKYKTVFCPYIYDHDRNQCVYAHNSQDFRRDPSIYKYEPVQCLSWSKGQIFSYDEGKCPNQMNCNFCHGWKELEFHPLYYKTKPCNNGKKCNKKDCPFYHSNAEKREPQVFQPKVQNFPTFQLSTSPHAPHTHSQPFHSGQKSADFGQSQGRITYEPQKSKFHKKKESHYNRPVMPVYIPTNKGNEPQEGSHMKAKRLAESSTRPNSNISSIHFSGEDAASRAAPKKKKGKPMSLQNKNEKLESPISAKSDKPKGQLGSDVSTVPPNIWERSNQENQEHQGRFDPQFFTTTTFEPAKPKSRGNDSFDSVRSYTVEKNVVTSEKQTEIANDQFIHTLFANLERKGLEYTIQHLKNANLDADSLKSFSSKDFPNFPQIHPDDKDRIVKIIQDILEEEAILSEINTVGLAASLNQNAGAAAEENSFPTNQTTYDPAQDFNIANLLHKYP